ncbi:hypothetical protein ABPG74_021455 [Tetrahymena malaccensis]
MKKIDLKSPFVQSSSKELKPKLISRNNQLQKCSTLVKSKDEAKTLQKESLGNEIDNKKVINIKMIINKSNQIEEAQKELLLKLQKNSCKVDLYLKTNFADDQQLLKFTISLQKIAHQLTYFTWIIEGKFTDDGQAKCIGEFIGKLTNAYRLELQLNSTFFADTGAIYLSKCLKKLINLHVFKFDLNVNIGVICKQITELGYKKIYDSIKCLPNLEIFDGYFFEDIFNENNLTLAQNECFPKLSHLLYPLNYRDQVDNIKYILDKKKNVLTSIKFGLFEPSELQEILNKNVIKIFQLFLNLPYLTKFNCFDDSYAYQLHYPLQGQEYLWIKKADQIICDLCQTRSNIIKFILSFDKLIKNEMTVNPQLIILDLYY